MHAMLDIMRAYRNAALAISFILILGYKVFVDKKMSAELTHLVEQMAFDNRSGRTESSPSVAKRLLDNLFETAELVQHKQQQQQPTADAANLGDGGGAGNNNDDDGG